MSREEFEQITAALIAVYAGELWAQGGFPNEFGADSISHLYEYIKLAKEIEMPLTDEGLVDTEVWREDVYNTVRYTYNHN